MRTGMYHYTVPDWNAPRNPDGTVKTIPAQMKVEIVAYGHAKTRIRFREYHRDGRPPGTTTWVYLKNVVTD